jgi:tritrans,polycis-undecaprenyl-diphosphate synthase [geranylgeranyl-diphosphate specific]
LHNISLREIYKVLQITAYKTKMTQAKTMPNHIAIVPDGNRRWAKKRGLDPWEGHREGADRIEELVNEALRLKIKNITFWGSSEDNMKKRPMLEKKALLEIYEEYFKKLISSKDVYEKGARINVFGRWAEQFPSKLVKILREGIERTKDHSNYCLNFLLAYNGGTDVLDGVKSLVTKVDGDESKVSEELFRESLMTATLPDVDLLVRTGVEDDPHNSAGFLMWQTQNSQYHFSNKLFPDFDSKELGIAIEDFKKRVRRLGK